MSLSLNLSPSNTSQQQIHSGKDESITVGYHDLLDSFLHSEEVTTQVPQKSENKPLAATNAIPQSVLDQQVNDQLRAIEQRIESIKNSVSRASTNSSKLEKDILESLPENNNFVALLKEKLTEAYALRGGNLSLIKSYTKSLNGLEEYEKTMQALSKCLNKEVKLLEKLESSSDLLFADIDNDSYCFTESLKQTNLVNEFSNSMKNIQNLINTLENSNNFIDSHIREMTKLCEKLEIRKNEITSYLKGPKNRHLALKDHNEFTQELNILETNIKAMTLNIVLIPTFAKTKDFTIDKLKGLKSFVEDLEKINLNYAKNILLTKKESELSEMTYNGEPVENLLYENPQDSHAQKV